MREKLIACLKDEVAPEIKRLRDPEAAILKVARDHHYAPSQVEALGQIFNTAKTLRYLEKSANRGESFPLLDVEQLVAKYLELPAEKSARKAGISQYDQLIDDPASGLPACFAGIEPSALTFALGTQTEEKPVTVKFASNNDRYKKAEAEAVEVIRAEFIDKAREEMTKIAHLLKRAENYSFTDLERDVLFVCGQEFKPVMDKLATFLAGERLPIRRADGAGPNRLFFDRIGVMDKVARLEECLVMIDAATDFIKEAAMTAVKPVETATAAEPKTAPGGHGKAPRAPEVKKKEPNKATGFIDSLIGAGQKAYAPVDHLRGLAKGVMGDPMSGQKQLDRTDLEAQHVSVLTDLMSTDPVLAESDHEKVVAMFNSIRQVAPQLAKDKNVMRVALRSAIQHDGISPFDLKAFLDTENAMQKVDFNQQLGDAVRYGGQKLSLPNKPQ